MNYEIELRVDMHREDEKWVGRKKIVIAVEASSLEVAVGAAKNQYGQQYSDPLHRCYARGYRFEGGDYGEWEFLPDHLRETVD